MQGARAPSRVCPSRLAGGHLIRCIAVTFAVLTLLIVAAPSRSALRPDTVAYWHRLHGCEQPSSWHVTGPTYPGGLGIYAPNWVWAARELGLLGRYPRADFAPVLVQIRVADYGYRVHHWYWACFRTVGYPPR